MGEASSNEALLKFLSSISFIFISISLIIIGKTPPASGYEISIYSSLPISFWILLVVAIFIGISIIVYSAFNNGEDFWLVGFIILIYGNTIVIGLQIFRDYYLYGVADPITHLHFMQDILSTGRIYSENYYPILHLSSAILTMITGISSDVIIKYQQIIISVSFMIFIYILSAAVFQDKGQAALSSACSANLLFTYYHLTPYPHAFGIFLLPLLFYLYFKTINNPSIYISLLLIILLILYPFIHPLDEIVMVGGLITGEIARILVERDISIAKFVNDFKIKLLSISLITFICWISYFEILGVARRTILNSIVTESAATGRIGELEPIVSRGLIDVLELSAKMYGHIIEFLLLSILCSLIIFYKFLMHKDFKKNAFIISVIFWGCMICYFTASMKIGLTTWGRILGANIGIWSAPILASFTLYEVSRIKIPKIVSVTIVIFILLTSSIIGIFGMYRSPWISQPNWQITKMDLAGLEWLTFIRQDKLAFAPMGFFPMVPHYFKMPEHFGYEKNNILGDSMNNKLYITLAKRFILSAEEPALKNWMNMPDSFAKIGFDKEDFTKFYIDPSVDKLYSNGELDVFIAVPHGGGR